MGLEPEGGAAGRPMIGGEAGLLFEPGNEGERIGLGLPYRRQEQAAPRAFFKDEAIDSGPKPGEEIGLRGRGNRDRIGEDGDIDIEPAEFPFPQRLEAWVLERGAECIDGDVGDQRPAGARGADTAP